MSGVNTIKIGLNVNSLRREVSGVESGIISMATMIVIPKI